MSNTRRNARSTWHELFAYMRKRNGGKLDLTEANLYNADLTEANLYNADLTNANLRCANLSNANLSNADLWNADLTDVTMNWLSHDLIARRLFDTAKTVQQRMISGLIGYSFDWCWDEMIKQTSGLLDADGNSLQAWALRTMATWVKEGDNAPKYVTQHLVKESE